MTAFAGHVRKREYRRGDRVWSRFVATVETAGEASGERERHEKSFARERDAKAWLSAQRAKAQLGVGLGEAPTVGTLLQSWLAHGETVLDWSPTHLDRSQRIVAHDLAPLSAVRIDQLRVEQVETLIGERRRAGLAPNSIRLMRNALSAALNLAIRRRLLAPGQNVARIANAPEVKRRPPAYLDPEAAARLLGALDDERLGPLFKVALALALRPGEALGLSWDAIDLAERTLRVEQSIQYVRGRYYRRDPKTDESRRLIRLPAELAVVLGEQRRMQLEERMQAPNWEESGLVFTNHAGRPLHEPYVNRRLRLILERAELPRVTFYQLRHTGATLMLAMGVPLEQIQEVMGHTSINTTRRYAALGDSLREAAADKMGSWLRETAHSSLGGTTGGTKARIAARPTGKSPQSLVESQSWQGSSEARAGDS